MSKDFIRNAPNEFIRKPLASKIFEPWSRALECVCHPGGVVVMSRQLLKSRADPSPLLVALGLPATSAAVLILFMMFFYIVKPKGILVKTPAAAQVLDEFT